MPGYWAVDGVPGGDAPSLASYCQSVRDGEGPEGPSDASWASDVEGAGVVWSECPRRNGRIYVSSSSGAVVPYRCGSNRCPYCLPRNARGRSQAIAWSEPQRAILLTQVGEDWQTVRARMKALRFELAAATGSTFEWVWHVEPNPRGTGHHVHAWQKGPFVPQRVLSAAAAGRGMGDFARVSAIRDAGRAGAYGLKGVGYGLKSVRGSLEAARGYVEANGGRLTHQSRAFFGRVGHGAVSVKEATRHAQHREGGDPGPWSLEQE